MKRYTWRSTKVLKELTKRKKHFILFTRKYLLKFLRFVFCYIHNEIDLLVETHSIFFLKIMYAYMQFTGDKNISQRIHKQNMVTELLL